MSHPVGSPTGVSVSPGLDPASPGSTGSVPHPHLSGVLTELSFVQ